MDLDKYINQFSIDEIIKIEHQDRQFLTLKKTREKINIWNDKNLNSDLFLFLILQNSIISYQIAWNWNLRREEFGQKIQSDFFYLKELFKSWKDNLDRRYKFITTSKYNKRLYNLKLKRLQKFEKFRTYKLNSLKKPNNFIQTYYKNLNILLEEISLTLNNKKNTKTVVFAIKMFGYWARIISKKFIYYPKNISIPVDSRLKKIYSIQFQIKNEKEEIIQKYFENLAKKLDISPLHLDSLLRIDYREKYIKSKKNRYYIN